MSAVTSRNASWVNLVAMAWVSCRLPVISDSLTGADNAGPSSVMCSRALWCGTPRLDILCDDICIDETLHRIDSRHRHGRTTGGAPAACIRQRLIRCWALFALTQTRTTPPCRFISAASVRPRVSTSLSRCLPLRLIPISRAAVWRAAHSCGWSHEDDAEFHWLACGDPASR